MKIDQSQIVMNSQAVQKIEREESSELRFWVGERPQFELLENQSNGAATANSGNSEAALAANNGLALGHDTLELSAEGRQKASQLQMTANRTNSTSDEFVYEMSSKDKVRVKLIQDFMERMTGKKVEMHVVESLKLTGTTQDLSAAGISGNPAAASVAASGSERRGWGLALDVQRTYRESSSFSFSSSGVVRTEDGREIDFSINLHASREYAEESSLSLRLGDAAVKLTDPLVISLDGKLPSLSDEKMIFDLDFDGTSDQISRLSSGSGFLALDINNDGQVNNGSELFGTVSGNGFADLAQYDMDQNGWIDENDQIFDKLRIWQQTGDGGSQLLALGETGIGAIYLGNVTDSYNLKNQANDLLGRVQSSGIYLKENGEAGTIHHIDLVS